MSNDLYTQLSEYGSQTREAREPVSVTDVVNRMDQVQVIAVVPTPNGRRGWHVAVAAAASTLLIVGGVAWLLGGGTTTESADGSGLTLPLEFPVSELPPFQLEVRYQLDSGVATGPDGVPEDLEALMTVSYGGPDLLRVDVNRNVQLFFPEPNGEPGAPHKAAGSFVILNDDSKAEYAAEDGTFFLTDKNFFNPLDPLLWETWEDICTYGDHEFLEAAPVAGRKAVHIRCTNGNDSYELWVDAETGLMLRIVGKDIPGNLLLISSGIQTTEYEVLSVAYEPLFAPDTFSLSAPQDATVEDFRTLNQTTETNQATETGTLPKGTAVPELTGQFLAGGDFTLADLEGNRVALLFWGSWCEPCLNALGELAVVAKERPDITFVTVLIEDRPEDASAMLAERQIILPTVDPDGLDGNSYFDQWGGDGIPLLILVETDGTVAAHHKGFGPLDLIQAILSDAGW